MFFFCIVFDFNKILTLKNEKYFSFSSLNRIFTVPLNKVRCISTIKKNGVFFVLSSIYIKSSRSIMKNIFHSLRLIGFLQYLCRSIYKKHII